jgi:hypothetical protein
MVETPAQESFSAFAARLGVRPSHVTGLRHAGRLVLSEDGKAVRVAESLALIESTRDPSKDGVRARHAVARGQGTAAGPDGDDEADVIDLPASNPHSERRAKALADKEEALARRALREELVEMGQLLDRGETVAALADAVVQLRSRLELLPVTLGKRLAGISDESECRGLLRDAVEQALDELARRFGAIGRVDG